MCISNKCRGEKSNKKRKCETFTMGCRKHESLTLFRWIVPENLSVDNCGEVVDKNGSPEARVMAPLLSVTVCDDGIISVRSCATETVHQGDKDGSATVDWLGPFKHKRK